jgi:outer membrane protein
MTRFFVSFAFVGIAFVGTRSAFAQEATPPMGEPGASARTMTLADALSYARAHQPAIHASLARIEAERAQADVPRGQWLPTVGVTAQIFGATENNTTASYVDPWFIDAPRIGGTRARDAGSASFAPYASTFAAAGITQELFDFGRIAAQSAAADALVDVRKNDAAIVRLDVDFGVEEAFFAERAAKAVLTASEDAYERSRVHRDLAQAGVSSGLRSPIELTRAEADLQRFNIGRTRAQGGVVISQSVLAASIGAPALRVDASAATPLPQDLPSVTEALQLATARDPRLLALVARLKAQELTTRAVRAELRPNLSLTGTLSTRAGGAPPTSGDSADYSGLLPSVPNWDAGLVLSWPLFDGTIDARVSAAHAKESVAREDLNVAKETLVAQVEQAYVAVDVARRALPDLQQAVKAAIANYAQADARFKAGMGTSVELADAEALRTDSEIQLAMGIFEVARTRAAFGRAIAEGI